MYLGGVVLLTNFPFVGEVRLTVLTRLRERAIRSFRTIDSNARVQTSAHRINSRVSFGFVLVRVRRGGSRYFGF